MWRSLRRRARTVRRRRLVVQRRYIVGEVFGGEEI